MNTNETKCHIKKTTKLIFGGVFGSFWWCKKMECSFKMYPYQIVYSLSSVACDSHLLGLFQESFLLLYVLCQQCIVNKLKTLFGSQGFVYGFSRTTVGFKKYELL